MSMKGLTNRELKEKQKREFAKLEPGAVGEVTRGDFVRHFFVAVHPVNETMWNIIELDTPNKALLVRGGKCKTTTLHLDEISHVFSS